jgi:hypothetical protein
MEGVQCLRANPDSNEGGGMAYVVKRSNRHGAKRFTGMYKAADGTYKSAGTYDTPERA